MKNLFVMILGLSVVALFSLQAGAMESDVQVQKRVPAPVQQQPPPRPRFVNNPYYNQAPTVWMTRSIQRVNVPYSQTTPQGGNSTASASQDLKQFSQQTQQQMSDFSKL